MRRPRCGEITCPDFGDPDFGEATCPGDHSTAPLDGMLQRVEAIAAELTKQWDWLANGHRASDYGHDILMALGNPDCKNLSIASDPSDGSEGISGPREATA